MSALAHLRAVARGERPVDDGLLGNARCSWGGADLLSEEAILASFAAHPLEFEDDVLCVETQQGAALIGHQGALVADVYQNRIGRLWRLAWETPDYREQSIDVAFDADMRQERGGLSFAPDDHPDLDPTAAQAIIAASRDLIKHVQEHDKLLRVRGFIVRAFGGPHASAALISLFTLDNQTHRSSAFSYAVIGIGPNPGDVRTIHPHPPARDWTPRF
jgi:hypothetical protein